MVPVRVEAGHGREAARLHAGDGGLVRGGVGEVKDQEVVLGGRAADGVPSPGRQLEVVGGAAEPQHDAVEAVVVAEAEQDLKAQPVSVKGNDGINVVGGPRDPNVCAVEGHDEARFETVSGGRLDIGTRATSLMRRVSAYSPILESAVFILNMGAKKKR